MPKPIGHRNFTDGVTRPVYRDAEGRQYILDDGDRVDGVWILEVEVQADEPIVVKAQ